MKIRDNTNLVHIMQKEDRSLAFTTGESVAESGIYSVHHPHSLPLQVTLLAGQLFPRCSKCSDKVRFQLARANPELDVRKDFRIQLYELPEVEPEEYRAA